MLSIFNIIVGAMIYIFAATKLYNLIKVITGSTSKYWEITMQLKEIMQVKKLPMMLQYRVFKCFQFYYHGTYFDEKRIMNSVSKQLK
ncbi:unnamed protein product, partial [Timema podura]|nr:unnamed protein product [Timema podura]